MAVKLWRKLFGFGS